MSELRKFLLLVYILALITTPTNAQQVKKGKTEVVKHKDFDVINIEAPNKNGVSVNDFDEFNVDRKGAVINNIEGKSQYETVHFGKIDGNKKITDKKADVAVFNVYGEKNTKLESTLEAASEKPLKLYIANENGIVVDGANFVNIDKLVLTSGKIDESDLAVLVRKGDVKVSQKGIKGLTNLAVFASEFDNKGTISSENLKLVLGHNFIRGEKAVYTLDNKYISANNLGSIYGKEINVQSTSYTDINVDNLLAKNNINIDTKGKVKNNGNILAIDSINIKAQSLENKGKVKFDNNSYTLKWIDANSKVYTKEQLESIWNKKIKHTLTANDTFLMLTGSLLNQWATDENISKGWSNNIFKRFDDVLNEFNNKDKNTFLIKNEGKEKVKAKHKQRDFVNKGDIYATEINDKKILEAVAVSNVKAEQANIFSKDVKIELTDQLLNQDANIEAVDNLDIKAKKLINKNSLSNDITLRDGYENIDWDLRVIQNDIRADYDITYERGIVNDNAARKTKIAAVNKSQIKSKNIKLDVDDIELHDEINTGVSIKADKLETKSKKLSLQGQSIEAKEYKLNTGDLVLKNASINTNNIDINAKKIELLSKKDKEIVIKTNKEDLTKEVISGSGIYAKNNLNVKSDKLTLKGSIIKADNKANINAGLLENLAEKVVKDYKSSYDISKSFRKINHKEKNETAIASFIYAKDLTVNSTRTNNTGSYIVGTNYINHNSKHTKIDAVKIKSELDKKYGVDNGILGVNYNKVKQMEEEAVGSIVLSKGEIKAKIDKELEIVGSTLKGKKILLEAENVKITSKELDKITETESRQLLAGDLNGSFEKNLSLDNISAKIDMELYKKEKTTIKSNKHSSSEVQGEDVTIVAKNENTITGSKVNADKLKLKGKTVKIEDAISKTEVEKNKVTVSSANKIAVNEGNLESDNKLSFNKTKENLNSESSNASIVNAKTKVEIQADKVVVKGSEVESKEVEIESKEKVDIVNSKTKEDYKKNSETVTLGSNVKLDTKSIAIIQTLKKIYDEKDNLLGYALNPVSGYQKIKEYKGMLQKNIENIQKLVENVSDKKLDPESLGIAMNVENSIKYNTNFLTSSKTENNGSQIKADKVNIKTNELTLDSSKIKANEAKIDAKKVELQASEKKEELNETDASVQASMVHDVISQNTSFKGDSTIQNKGNYKKEYTSSKIEVEEIDLKTEELSLQNSQIEAKDGKVEAKKTNIYDKANTETKYGAALTGMYNGGPKIGVGNVTVKVEHEQKVINESSIKVENGKVNSKEENKKKEMEANINVNTQLGLNVDPDGKVKGKASGGAKTKLNLKGKKVKGAAYAGVNGDLSFEDGEITDSNVSAELKGDLTINPDKNIEEIKLQINNEFSLNNEGEIENNTTTKVDATIAHNTEDLKGKLNLSFVNETSLNEKGLSKFDNKFDSNGELEAKLKLTEFAKTDLKLNGNLKVDKKLGQKVNVNADASAESNISIKGQTDNVSGALDINLKGKVEANEKGITNVEGTAKGNGQAEVSGKLEHLVGKLVVKGTGEASANKEGLKNLEGKLEADGDLEAKGQAGVFSGNLKLQGHTDIAAKKGEEVKLNGKLTGESNLEVAGKTENVDGAVKLNLKAEVSGSEKGLEKLEGTAKGNGQAEVSGKLEHLVGKLVVKGTGEASANKEGLKNLEGKLEADGDLEAKGQAGVFTGDLKLQGHTDIAAKKGEKAKLNGNLTGESNLEVAGKTENVDGAIKLNLKAEVAGSEKGLEKLEGTAKGNGQAEVSGEIEHLVGKLVVKGNGEASATEKGLKTLEGKLEADGDLEAKGQAGVFAGDLKLQGHTDIAAKKGEKVKLNGKLTGESNLEVAGKTENVDGLIKLKLNSEIAGTEEGLKTLEGTAQGNGRLDVKGKLSALKGNLHLETDALLKGGKGKELQVEGTAKGNGKVEVSGEIEHLAGKLVVKGNGEASATEKGLNTLEGKLETDGKLKAQGSKGVFSGDLTVEGHTDIAAKKGEKVKLNGKLTGESNLEVAGKTENVDGAVKLNLKAEVSGSEKGLEKLEGTAKGNGQAEVSGEIEHLVGKLVVKGNGEASATEKGLKTLEGKLEADGDLEAKGQAGVFAGDLKLQGHTDIAAKKGEKVKLNGNLTGESNLEVAGKTENVDGAVKLNLKAEVSGSEKGLEKLEGTAKGNGQAEVSGKLEHLVGKLVVKGTGEASATEKGLNTLEGKLETDGKLKAQGSKGVFSGDLTVEGHTDIAAKKGEEVKLNGKLTGESNLGVKGNSGYININPAINIQGNNKNKLEVLDTNVNVDGEYKSEYDSKYLKDLFVKLESQLNTQNNNSFKSKAKIYLNNVKFEIDPKGKLLLKDNKYNLNLGNIEELLKKINFEI